MRRKEGRWTLSLVMRRAPVRAPAWCAFFPDPDPAPAEALVKEAVQA